MTITALGGEATTTTTTSDAPDSAGSRGSVGSTTSPAPAGSHNRTRARSVTIVGTGLAGHSAAKSLRSLGFDGDLRLVGAEVHRPYDRPPLTKDFLLGTLDETDLGLERDGEDLQADWLLGYQAASLETGTDSGQPRHRVLLTDGSSLDSDAVIIATGSRVRRIPTMLSGVHTVRTLDDARALKGDLQPGARLVVIGAGFIGAEIAGVARRLGLEVTVLEASPTPLTGPLGAEAGELLAALHEQNGVTLRCQATVSGLQGTTHVTGVELAGGEVLPADVVVVGIGAVADTEWLTGSGVDVTPSGIRCDHTGTSNVPGVFAVGDCAAWLDPVSGWHRRIEHWTDAKDRGAVTAAALLGATLPTSIRAPYFWSDQYGCKIQFAGRRNGDEQFVIESGDVASGSMLATYRKLGEPVGVLALGRQPEFMKLRKQLSIAMPSATASNGADVTQQIA